MPFSVNLPTPCDAAGARTPLLKGFGTPFVSPFILKPFAEASGRRCACTEPAQGVPLQGLVCSTRKFPACSPFCSLVSILGVTKAQIGDGALFVRSLICS